MATLYEALVSFKDIYDQSISKQSKREFSGINKDWQTINNEWDCYYSALAAGNSAGMEENIQNIISILNGYDLTVDEPVPAPLSLSIYSSPSVISVSVDQFGSNPTYTNSLSTMAVYVGGLDDTSNWTFSIGATLNTIAVIQNDTEVKVSSLTADYGTVTVWGSKSGYSDLSFTISVNKSYAAEDGLSINSYPSSIISVSDADGSNPELTTATSVLVAREGIDDETDNWSFVVQSVTGVTAVIQNDNELKINSLPGNAGSVTVRCSRSGYGDQDIDIPVKKYRKLSDGGLVQNANLSLQPNDEGLVAGDSRGANAVDLQTTRSSSDQVASGGGSFIGGGSGNKASGAYSLVNGGIQNTASGIFSTVNGGGSNTASGQSSTVSGGESNTANGIGSAITGGAGNTASSNHSTLIGNGGTSNIAGEIVKSFSDSPTKNTLVTFEGISPAAPAYNAGTTYNTGDVVSSTLKYRSLTDSNIGNTPASSPSDWEILVTDLITFDRDSSFSSAGEAFNMDSNTLFVGTISRVGVQSDGAVNYVSEHVMFICDGVGAVTRKTLTSPGNTYISEFTYASYQDITELNVVTQQVNVQGELASKWAATFEGIIIDTY